MGDVLVEDIENEGNKVKTLLTYVDEFREQIQMAWSTRTAKEKENLGLTHENEKPKYGRLYPAGQCSVTCELLTEELSKQFPEFGFRTVSGSITQDGTLLHPDHVWIEGMYQGERYVVDPTADQIRFSDHLQKIVIFSQQELERDRIVYGAQKNNSIRPGGNTEKRLIRLRKRLQVIRKKWGYLKEMLNSNVFIIGGVATGKNAAMEYLSDKLVMHGLDTGQLFRLATHALLSRTTQHPFKPDLNALRSDHLRLQEEQKVDAYVTRNIGFVRNVLRRATVSVRSDGKQGISIDGKFMVDELYSADVGVLVPIIAAIPEVRSVVWDWVEQYLRQTGGQVMTGHTLRNVDTTRFRVIQLVVDEQVAVARLMQREDNLTPDEALRSVRLRNEKDDLGVTTEFTRDLHAGTIIDATPPIATVGRRMIKDLLKGAKYKHRIRVSQTGMEIPRQRFQWPQNPLVSGIRDHSGALIAEIAAVHREEGITPMDLSVQTAMHLAAYPTAQVWSGQPEIIQALEEMVEQLNPDLAESFSKFVASGEIRLNMDIVSEVAQVQVQRLLAIFNEHTDSNVDLVTLVKRMGVGQDSPMYRPSIGKVERGRLDMNNRRIDNHSGIPIWIGVETLTDRRITFKPVPRNVSTIYTSVFHYLHQSRDDEMAAFGAYLDDDPWPFALASFSPVDRGYKQDMLFHLGFEPSSIVEFTRGWNCPWSPENTLSQLFHYAHEVLKATVGDAHREYKRPTPLRGVVTAINPNLGFKAHAFNGVKYLPIGLKPAGFTYLKEENETFTYMPRRELEKVLQVKSRQELRDHPRFHTNRIPMVPTIEMMVPFSAQDQRAILEKPIYRVPDTEY